MRDTCGFARSGFKEFYPVGAVNISDKLKKEPITESTIIDIKYYRLITGACELGVKSWVEQNKITKDSYTAKELLPILEQTNAYGLDKFKSLIVF